MKRTSRRAVWFLTLPMFAEPVEGGTRLPIGGLKLDQEPESVN
jgi:hypothetical protein